MHYGEVLQQDCQLDNGSRLEKFRGKEGQTLDRVIQKNAVSTLPTVLMAHFLAETPRNFYVGPSPKKTSLQYTFDDPLNFLKFANGSLFLIKC